MSLHDNESFGHDIKTFKERRKKEIQMTLLPTFHDGFMLTVGTQEIVK